MLSMYIKVLTNFNTMSRYMTNTLPKCIKSVLFNFLLPLDLVTLENEHQKGLKE